MPFLREREYITVENTVGQDKSIKSERVNAPQGNRIRGGALGVGEVDNVEDGQD